MHKDSWHIFWSQSTVFLKNVMGGELKKIKIERIEPLLLIIMAVLLTLLVMLTCCSEKMFLKRVEAFLWDDSHDCSIAINSCKLFIRDR